MARRWYLRPLSAVALAAAAAAWALQPTAHAALTLIAIALVLLLQAYYRSLTVSILKTLYTCFVLP